MLVTNDKDKLHPYRGTITQYGKNGLFLLVAYRRNRRSFDGWYKTPKAAKRGFAIELGVKGVKWKEFENQEAETVSQ